MRPRRLRRRGSPGGARVHELSRAAEQLERAVPDGGLDGRDVRGAALGSAGTQEERSDDDDVHNHRRQQGRPGHRRPPARLVFLDG